MTTAVSRWHGRLSNRDGVASVLILTGIVVLDVLMIMAARANDRDHHRWEVGS